MADITCSTEDLMRKINSYLHSHSYNTRLPVTVSFEEEFFREGCGVIATRCYSSLGYQSKERNLLYDSSGDLSKEGIKDCIDVLGGFLSPSRIIEVPEPAFAVSPLVVQVRRFNPETDLENNQTSTQ
jgi:hypothetical protein